MDCDEHIILKKLRDGDSEALDILYLRYASKVRDFAFRLLKDRTDAEDVTHDIFLKIWEQGAREHPVVPRLSVPHDAQRRLQCLQAPAGGV